VEFTSGKRSRFKSINSKMFRHSDKFSCENAEAGVLIQKLLSGRKIHSRREIWQVWGQIQGPSRAAFSSHCSSEMQIITGRAPLDRGDRTDGSCGVVGLAKRLAAKGRLAQIYPIRQMCRSQPVRARHFSRPIHTSRARRCVSRSPDRT